MSGLSKHPRAIGLAAIAAAMVCGNASADRLFGTANGVDGGIFELDPVAGTIINRIGGPLSGPRDGLAYDGESLWFLGDTLNTLYRLDPDTGETLDIFALPADPDPIPEDNGDLGVRGGLAYLNGLIYITQWDRPIQDIEIFDPAVGQVVGTLDIDGMNPGSRTFGNSGLAAIIGPDQLIISTSLTQELHFLNPTTGVIERTIGHNQFGVLGIAVIGGELYLGSDQLGAVNDGIETIHVYNRDVEQLRFFNFDNATNIFSLAGDHTANIPEPGSAALLALGTLALLHRRR